MALKTRSYLRFHYSINSLDQKQKQKVLTLNVYRTAKQGITPCFAFSNLDTRVLSDIISYWGKLTINKYRMEYVYKVKTFYKSEVVKEMDLIEKEIKSLGLLGWEMCGVVDLGEYAQMIFKVPNEYI